MSTKSAALETEKCFVCEAPTTNKPYLGQILCYTCIADLDDKIDQAIEEPEEHFNDLDY